MKLWTLKHLLSIQFNTDIIWQFECESKNSTVRLVALGMLPSTLLLHFSRENGAQHSQRQVQTAWQKAYMGTWSRVGPCQDAEVWYWWEGSPHIPAATRVSHLLDKAAHHVPGAAWASLGAELRAWAILTGGISKDSLPRLQGVQ